jgi:hypothetical protein
MDIYEHNADDGQEEAPTEMTMEEFNEYKASCLFLIGQAKAAAKLAQDPAFKQIIMEDYFSNEPKRLGCLMASGRLTPAGFDGAVDDLRSIGHLRNYLQAFIEKGNIAAGELENLEIARAEAVAS